VQLRKSNRQLWGIQIVCPIDRNWAARRPMLVAIPVIQVEELIRWPCPNSH
jgi:hypothetical protein